MVVYTKEEKKGNIFLKCVCVEGGYLLVLSQCLHTTGSFVNITLNPVSEMVHLKKSHAVNTVL